MMYKSFHNRLKGTPFCGMMEHTSLFPMRRSQFSSLLLLFAFSLFTSSLLSSCTADEATPPSSAMGQARLTICLQPEAYMPTRTPRTPGDPGTYEHLRYPRYFYLYPVAFTSEVYDPTNPEKDDIPVQGGGTVCALKDGENNDVNRIDVGDDPLDWNHYYMYVDPPQTLNDSVYGSTHTVSFALPSSDITLIRFFVAASAVPLMRKVGDEWVELGIGSQVLGAANTETDVLNLMFDVPDEQIPYLQDIYSSPYNYAPAAPPYNGYYYYTIFDPTQPIDITRIIYHVAAKVDIDWNVDPARQADYRITHIEARRLKQRNCYLFRQTENEWTSADKDNNYSQVIMDADVGQQWYGRQYFYTIPYGPTFNTQLHIRKNGDDASAVGYNLKLTKSMAPFPIFTPWLRADLRFTSGMDYSPTEKEKSMD